MQVLYFFFNMVKYIKKTTKLLNHSYNYIDMCMFS